MILIQIQMTIWISYLLTTHGNLSKVTVHLCKSLGRVGGWPSFWGSKWDARKVTMGRTATWSVRLMSGVTPMELQSVWLAGRVQTHTVTHVSPITVSPFFLFFNPWQGRRVWVCLQYILFCQGISADWLILHLVTLPWSHSQNLTAGLGRRPVCTRLVVCILWYDFFFPNAGKDYSGNQLRSTWWYQIWSEIAHYCKRWMWSV